MLTVPSNFLCYQICTRLLQWRGHYTLNLQVRLLTVEWLLVCSWLWPCVFTHQVCRAWNLLIVAVFIGHILITFSDTKIPAPPRDINLKRQFMSLRLSNQLSGQLASYMRYYIAGWIASPQRLLPNTSSYLLNPRRAPDGIRTIARPTTASLRASNHQST